MIAKTQFVVNEIYELYHLVIRELDPKGNVIVQPNDELERNDPVQNDPVQNDKSLFEAIVAVFQKDTAKCQLYQEKAYVYSVFSIQQHYMILGPIALEEQTQHQKHAYVANHNVANQELAIPYMSISYLKEITAFVYGILLENYETSENLFGEAKKRKAIEEEIHQELTEYVLTTSEQEKIHFSFEEEKLQAEHIIHGEHVGIVHKNGENSVYSQKFVGKMAKTPIKQVEYECVCWITLMTRYAIEAGVCDATSYALSDVTLQKLSVANTTVEMEHIFDSSMKEFDALIREVKTLKENSSPYIDRCKDYIAKHIYEKIRLEELADEVGLHPVYLSRLFSEKIGMPITNYIMQEKIKLSCNLLKYSGKSIATIAEYMNLSPQSYYTRVFKKVMNQSPAQYRKEHLDKKFYES